MPSLGSILKRKKTKDKDGDGEPASQTASKTTSNTTSNTTNNEKPIVSTVRKPDYSDKGAGATAASQDIMTQQAPEQKQPTSALTPAQQQNQANMPANGTIQPAVATSVEPTAEQKKHMTKLADGQWPVFRDSKDTKGKYTLKDFDFQRTLGTGSFGRVHLVKSKHNQRFYAVKVLKKAQVVKMKQIEHTNDERRMLAKVKHPFLITLWGTYSDSKNLYMVMDFIEGGELFSLLRKSQV